MTKGGNNNNNKKTNPTISRCKIKGKKNQICTFRQININSYFVKVKANSYLEILINTMTKKNVSSQRTT